MQFVPANSESEDTISRDCCTLLANYTQTVQHGQCLRKKTETKHRSSVLWSLQTLNAVDFETVVCHRKESGISAIRSGSGCVIWRFSTHHVCVSAVDRSVVPAHISGGPYAASADTL